MKCLNCGKPTRQSLRCAKWLKYCSKKCANEYKHELERQKHPRYNDPTWKKGGKRALRVAKLKEEFEYAQKHYVRQETVAEKLNITVSALWQRSKKANVERIRTYEDGKGRTFYKPEDIDKLRITEPDIPKGYVTAYGAAEYLGVTHQSFFTMGSKRGFKRPDPTIVQWGSARRNLYSIQDLDKWLAQRSDAERKKKLKSEQNRIKREKAKKKAEADRLADQKSRTVDIGLITIEDASVLLGLYNAYAVIKANNIPYQKVGYRKWFKPEHIIELKKQRQAAIIARKTAARNKTFRYKNKPSFVERYEARRKKLAELAPPSYMKKNENKIYLKMWHIHTEPWRLEEEENTIVKLTCSACAQNLPYSEFPIAFKQSSRDLSRYGRSTQCHNCCREKRKGWRTKKHPKTRNKFATQFAVSIQRSLSKRLGVYTPIPHEVIWKELKKHLGYTKDELLDHIELQFKPWMNWANNGRPKDTDNPAWNLDHIKPKSHFMYTSISDSEFIECWALQNLQPIEARLNLIKSDKNLRARFQSSFRQGIKSKKILRSGIWAFLPYTNIDAQVYIESQFKENMTWDNYGTLWHIDHIVPQAYLSYNSPYEENFQICWELKNLVPITVRANSAKRSKHLNKLWYHNNIK